MGVTELVTVLEDHSLVDKGNEGELNQPKGFVGSLNITKLGQQIFNFLN